MSTTAARPTHPISRMDQQLPTSAAVESARWTGVPVAPIPSDDDALLDAARHGDPGAVEELYRRHRSRAQAVARRHATPEYPAQDLAADAMIAMLQALARGEGPRSSVPGYLAVSIRNLAAHAARRRAHAAYARPTPTESLGSVAADPHDLDHPEHALMEAETRRQLAITLAELQPSARQVLLLLHVEFLTVPEVASRLGISSEAVRSLSYRARKALRRHYRARWLETVPS